MTRYSPQDRDYGHSLQGTQSDADLLMYSEDEATEYQIFEASKDNDTPMITITRGTEMHRYLTNPMCGMLLFLQLDRLC